MPVLHGCLVAFMENQDDGSPRAGACPSAGLKQISRPHGTQAAGFNIAGNKYRIVVWINYPYRVVYIRFIGTHRRYDRIDARMI